MARFQIRSCWANPEAARTFAAAVSLHSHTSYSREPLSFLPDFVRRSGALGRLLRGADDSRLWWTPPLSPRQAWQVEKSQIEADLGLLVLISLTDHDAIDAPLMVRILDESRDAPVSVEWTVPFRETFFHLGVHNLPGPRAASIFAEMAAYTARPRENALPGILEELDRDPDVLIVFNHPMWDENRIGRPRHRRRVAEFLRAHGRRIHALEWNGFRGRRENALTVELARWSGMALISGGDRHGREPSSVLNLTNARNFSEFVREFRGGAPSELLLMPQQRRSRRLRVLRSVADVFGGDWSERIFYQCDDGRLRPLAQFWGRAPAPLWLSGFARALQWLNDSGGAPGA
ncbi:MAG: hypothetical protein KIT09_12950 [Bryobacteraceae bacterium]|nr:hypothetical protein [Bryobacteraceae bacterium]